MRKLENYLNNNYEFKYNTVLNKTFFKKKSEKTFRELFEYEFNSILRGLNHDGSNPNKAELQALLKSDYVPTIDPIEEYLDSLPTWDGTTDYINELAKTISTTDDTYFQWLFKKWFVAMVACAVDESITNQTVLILIGKQGCGKTTWLEKLIPKELERYIYRGIINPSNKDTKIAMSENLLMNLDELSSFNVRQISAFKEMITLTAITERRPYATYCEKSPRRASFVGSSNEKEILSDITGNRRFLCIEVLTINNNNVDLSMTYAQAYKLYKDGYQYYFDAKDIEKVNEHNEHFLKVSTEVDLIDQYLKIPLEKDTHEYMNATEIIDYIKSQGTSQRLDPIQVGKILNTKGFQTKKCNGIKKYIISKI